MRKPSMTVLIGLLLILLPLLAVLQYRWLTEVSQGERVQMQLHLHAAAEQFTSDFDRELTRAFLVFQPEPQFGTADATPALAAEAAQSWRLWTTTAPHPELVRALDLVEAEGPGRLRLLRFDPQQAHFVEIGWPSGLTAWRDRLATAWPQPGPEPQLPESLTAANAAELPVIPVFFPHGLPRPPSPGRHAGSPPSPTPFPQQMFLLELNLPWLQHTFLPQLAERAFAVNGATEYHVVIVNPAAPGHPVFGWGPDPDPSARRSPPDLTAPMFRVRVADFVAIRARPGRPQAPARLRLRREVRSFRIRHHGPQPRFRVFFPAASFFPAANFPGRWQLQVRHRAGSLAAAVARVRRRNLAISGGILLLLLASVGLLMQLAHKAERLARQQMEFVAGVSHELRTPLAVISSAAANLSDGVVSEPAQVARYGALIGNEGRRLNAMVEQILEFASLQYRPQPVQTQPVAVAAVVQEAVQAAGPALAEAHMRLECWCSEETPLTPADPAALRRCLDNLIGNAIKYAAEAGWIGIRTEHDADEVRVTVEDHGPGIEAGDVPHLFTPFYRGRLAHERQIHGNGLGLALVQRLMQAQGGTVTVHTRVGHGTAFTLHFPRS